jgi:hypothetical protein
LRRSSRKFGSFFVLKAQEKEAMKKETERSTIRVMTRNGKEDVVKVSMLRHFVDTGYVVAALDDVCDGDGRGNRLGDHRGARWGQ